jgi:chromosome segregation ATPase
MLMMGILSIFIPENGARAEEKRAAYDRLQGLLENMARGIEEKQAEMREMDLSLSTKRAELIELEKTIRRRQKLLNLTSREIEEGMLKLMEEKKAEEERKAQVEESVNCTTPVIEPESLVVKQRGVSRIQTVQSTWILTVQSTRVCWVQTGLSLHGLK